MWHQVACQAMAERKCLEIRYDGYIRIVEVHACGVTKEGHGVMRVWQVRGGSAHNEPVGWKMLRLDETIGHGITDEPSQAPRQGYRRNDTAMRTIFCQL